MIQSLVRFALGHKVFVNLAFFLLMFAGFFALLSLPVEQFPNVQIGKIFISTFYPGASPADVEALVTKKIEDALSDVENIEFIQATSYRERSSIMVKFIDDTDYETGYDRVRFKVLSTMNELPELVDPPLFFEIDMANWIPSIVVNLVGDRSNRALSLMADQLRIPLRRIEGVKEVDVQGEYTREFHIYINPEQLIRYGITFEEVVRALQEANIAIPAGDYSNRDGDFIVQVDEKFRSREQVAATIIRRDADGSFVTLADVMSEAVLSHRDPFVITSVNGRNCVSLRIIKTSRGNTISIVRETQKILDEFRPTLAREGVDIVLTQDQRIRLFDSLNTLLINLVVGMVLVFGIIWLFLGKRNALLTTVGIPFSFLVTLIFTFISGNSLNEITLFAFVLVGGIIVDDAIVVVENIHRHYNNGSSLTAAVANGTAEVAWPVIAATSTTVATFLPMLIMTGSTGEFFALIPKGVSAAIAASLIECLLILPVHFADWPGLKASRKSPASDKKPGDRIIGLLLPRVTALVKRCLDYRAASLSTVFGAFVTALLIFGISVSGVVPLIKIKFYPEQYDIYFIDVFAPVSTPIENVSNRLNSISKFIMDMGPGMAKAATANAGSYFSDDYEYIYERNVGHVIVELPVSHNREFADYPENDPQAHLEHIRDQLARFNTDGFKIQVRAQMNGPPAGKDINIRIVGSNPDMVQGLASAIEAYTKADKAIAPYLVDFSDDQGRPSRVFRFKALQEKAAEFGLTKGHVARLAGAILDGRYIGKFRTADEEVDLKVRITPDYLDNPSKALSLPLLEHPSGPVTLGDLCRVESFTEPSRLARYEGDRAITFTANIASGAPVSPASVVHRVQKYYKSIQDRYPGAALSFAGAFESTKKSYSSLAYAFIIALIIIYLILATEFKSYLQPLIILSSVVFSLIGVIFGAFISQTLFTVDSFIATVGVTGVVVNDSLVLVDFINRCYASGMSRHDAIMEGVRVRLRPILLTTLTTTLALLPMALGIPKYSIVWGCMASTFVTGLCTATFLTLLIIPVLWDVVVGIQERFGKREGTYPTETTSL